MTYSLSTARSRKDCPVFSTGAVDAAVVTYGQADSLVEQGKATILHKGVEADPDTFYEPNVLTGRSDYISANSDVTVAIIKAMLKSIQ